MTPAPPFLRTLAPLLRGLDRRLRLWLDGVRPMPLSAVRRAAVEGAADDLTRKADALDVERPLLVVMLMGGTGVGKSTLFNALAGGPIAQASFTRPTTRDPVVYFHHSVPADRLDPALRKCRLAQHDKDELAQKVIVDTPDLDSNETENRERLVELLPVADVVLYVGSQEKYHDRLGWDLFKAQRRRRAFAFVLNKWDRCSQKGETGVRPDDDLLRDLHGEGFENPRLFRTTAQKWVDANGTPPADLPPGEQFGELKQWLELGLTALEIEAVKARGVGQLVDHTISAMDAVRPPDLTVAAAAVRDGWERHLATEAEVTSEVLVGSLEPYRHEVEHHFTVTGRQRFRGLTAGYLRLTTRLRYAGSTLRDRIPLVPKSGAKVEASDLDLIALAQESARAAGDRVLDQRTTALVNRLLVDADQKGFPLTLLNGPTASAAKLDWHDRLTRSVVESLTDAEREAAEPTGWRRLVRGGVGFLANALPEFVLVASIVVLMYLWIYEQVPPTLSHMLMPIYLTVGTLVILHVLISLAFPVRWSAIRGEFQRRLDAKVNAEFARGYLGIPDDVATELLAERQKIDAILAEAREVAEFVAEREAAARVSELYGQ